MPSNKFRYDIIANDKASKKVGLISSKFAALGSTIKRRFGPTGAIATMLAFGAAVHKSLNFVDEIAKTSRLIGIQSENLQAWRLAAVDAGGTAEEFTKGMLKLTRSIGEADIGLARQVQAFESLGVSVRDRNGDLKSTDDIVRGMAVGMANLGSRAEQAAIGAAIFGRGWQSMLPLLIEGGEGLDKAGESAARLGLVINDEMLYNAELATSAMTRAGEAAKVGMAKAFASTAPIVTALAEAFIDVQKPAQDMVATIGRGFDWIAEYAVRLGGALEAVTLGGFFEVLILELRLGLRQLIKVFTESLNTLVYGINFLLPESFELPGIDTTKLDAQMRALSEKLNNTDIAKAGTEAVRAYQAEQLEFAQIAADSQEIITKRRVDNEAAQIKKLAAIERQAKLANLTTARNFGNQLVQLGQAFSAKNKGLAIAGIALDGWQAIQSAYSTGMRAGGLPLAIAQMAIAGATTAATLAAAKSGRVPAAVAASGGALPSPDPIVQAGPQVNVSLIGDNFGRDDVASVLEQINEKLGGTSGQVTIS